ncbi:hypothetical protein F5141DRAFT_1156810 [Pisolithus sp. B1]|nr:hypothetical protein F5141DRAFT_1156810 [Pisolithus sp. B1]
MQGVGCDTTDGDIVPDQHLTHLGVHQCESQFDGGTCEAELLFVACTCEAFLIFSRYPVSGCKYALSMSRAEGTFISLLYSSVSECVNVDTFAEKGLRGCVGSFIILQGYHDAMHQRNKTTYFPHFQLEHLPFLTPDVPLDGQLKSRTSPSFPTALIVRKVFDKYIKAMCCKGRRDDELFHVPAHYYV